MLDKERARTQVATLVTKYNSLTERDRRDYSEEEVKQGFLLPLFRILGWAVEDRHEVRAEARSGRGFADYLFLIDGITVFPLEAKNFRADLDDTALVKQTISYAWNKNVPWAVLSNFERLIILVADPQITPVYQTRLRLLRCEDYSDEDFEDLWLLSRPAMAQRRLERLAEREGRLAPRSGVSDALFADLTRWRRLLFAEITQMRVTLWSQDQRMVDEAISRFLDRLIFIRTLEDRGIEENRLLSTLRQQGEQKRRKRPLFDELLALFREMDRLYNSRLFAAHALDTPSSLHNDVLLGEIIEGLWKARGREARYDFATIDADVLGAVYEQYLAFRSQDPSGTKDLEESRGRRKAFGIYYTPVYVVRHIVRQTLGRLLAEPGMTAQRAHSLRILDPACGSGSFLIEAFRVLDEWLAQHGDAEDRAYPHIRRQRILTRNLYGVDLDPHAVEVARLNLLLRAAWQRGRLPMLHNIRHGNSLIDDESLAGSTAFDWHDQFPQVMDSGGFDIVIGNPPYGASLKRDPQDFLNDRYSTFGRVKDVYTCFIELSIQLLRDHGLHSFIVPAAWLGGPAYGDLRSLLLHQEIDEILALPFDVFDAYIDTSIFVLRKSPPSDSHVVRTFRYFPKTSLVDINIRDDEFSQVRQSDWASSQNRKFVLDGDALRLVLRLSQTHQYSLADVIQIRRGVLFDHSLLTESRVNEHQHLYFEGDIYRYVTNEKLQNWVEYGPRMKEYPRDFFWFEGERLLLRRLVNRRNRLMCSIVNTTFITNKNLYSIKPKDSSLSANLLLALLNSKLISFLYLSQVSQATKDDFPQVTIQDLKSLPFPETDCTAHNAIISLVERMLVLQSALSDNDELFDDARHLLKHRIDTLDAQIDAHIYALYGLDEAEIALVEGRAN